MNRNSLIFCLALLGLTGCEEVSVTRVHTAGGAGGGSCVVRTGDRTFELRGGNISSLNVNDGAVSLRSGRHRVRFDGRKLAVDGRQVTLPRFRKLVLSLENGAVSVRVDGRDPFAGAPAEEIKAAIRTERFSAADLKSVSLHGLSERFVLRVEEGRKDVAVLREGYEDELGNLAVHSEGRKLQLRGKAGFQPKVTVAVPPGLRLRVVGCNGGEIGDTRARLELTASGSQDYKVGRVKGASVKVSGFGDVKVAEITGALAEVIAGGSGAVEVGAVSAARTAIDCSGFGSVKFAKLTGEEAEVISKGSGDVELGPGKLGTLSVESSGFGDVTCRARAGRASLTARGSGNVEVTRPGTVEKLEAKGFGGVKFIGR
jgi:hypothetical protein